MDKLLGNEPSEDPKAATDFSEAGVYSQLQATPNASQIGLTEDEYRTRVAEFTDAEKASAGYIETNVWNLYEGNVRAYDMSFDEILTDLGFRSFQQWMRSRKAAGLTTHVLDVMGGNGTFLRGLSKDDIEVSSWVDPAFDKSLVVTLVSDRTTEKKIREDERRSVDVISGDITLDSTWDEVDKWLQVEGIAAFDLIVCRGVDGIRYIPISLYAKIFSNLYRRTSNNEGVIISQVHEDLDTRLSTWAESLEETAGIEAYSQEVNLSMGRRAAGGDYPAIGIRKSNNAPLAIDNVTEGLAVNPSSK